ncbi:MAG: YihY/virulence factor BrkB family protein, partial [Muribaculaceae bacterium]|nr:YihY/virulence factor BrkB family protein [Muribaculaceae bacterium]
LWTLISLLSSVEDVFNVIWGVKRGRTMWRKITDYTAIFLVLPILMICSSGLTLFITSIQNELPHNVISPLFKFIIDFSSIALTCLFFTGVYMLIPNTKVKFKNALVSGILAGISYQILQWLFVSGQVYVSKYNAIYGGFAFLPLLLLWMQLVWLITLSGAVLCYSSQNIFQFSFFNESKDVSIDYRRIILISVIAVIQQRFTRNLPPLRPSDFVQIYTIPTRLIEEVVNDLEEAGLISRVADAHDVNAMALQPAHDLSATTIGDVIHNVESQGASGFIPEFDIRFSSVIKALSNCRISSATLLNDLKIDLNTPISAK